MKEGLCGKSAWALAAVLMIAVSAASAEESTWSRRYRSDIYVIGQSLGSDEVTAGAGLIEIEADSTAIFGAGIGFNFTRHLNLNTEFMLGQTDVEGTSVLDPEASYALGDTTIWLWDLNLDYNILKGRLTPLVSGGIGAMGFDGDDNTSEIDFAYNVGAGIRWDVTDHFALRVLYRLTRTELDDADRAFHFDGVSASLIYTFK